MAITYVQGCTTFLLSSGPTDSVVFPSNTTNGNFIAVGIFLFGSGRTVSSVVDSQSNTYSRVTTFPSNSQGFVMDLWVSSNSTAGVNLTIVVTASGTCSLGIYTIAQEFSGVAHTSNFDISAVGQTGTSTSPATPSITTTNADDLIIALANIENSPVVFTSGGSFGNLNQFSFTDPGAGAFAMNSRVVSATGSYSQTFTTNSSSAAWEGAIAAFKASDGQVSDPGFFTFF